MDSAENCAVEVDVDARNCSSPIEDSHLQADVDVACEAPTSAIDGIPSKIKRTQHFHVTYANLAEVRYPRLPPGHVLKVLGPNGEPALGPIESETVLVTRGATAYLENPTMEIRHCPHFHFCTICQRGPRCDFIHHVHLAFDAPVSKGQRPPILFSPQSVAAKVPTTRSNNVPPQGNRQKQTLAPRSQVFKVSREQPQASFPTYAQHQQHAPQQQQQQLPPTPPYTVSVPMSFSQLPANFLMQTSNAASQLPPGVMMLSQPFTHAMGPSLVPIAQVMPSMCPPGSSLDSCQPNALPLFTFFPLHQPSAQMGFSDDRFAPSL